MSEEGKIQVVKAGGNVADQVKAAMQAEMQAKQMAALKQQIGLKLGGVINILMQTFAVDNDNAISTALDYAATLAIATGTPKEAVLKGFDKIWDDQVENSQRAKKQQATMMVNAMLAMMEAKQDIPGELATQAEQFGAEFPDTLKAYLEEHTAKPNGARGKLEVVPDSKPDEVKN